MNSPEKLQDMCEDYLVRDSTWRRCIRTDNCLFLLTFSDRAKLKNLFQKSLEFCLDHFTQLTDTDEFVCLDKSLLIQLLQSCHRDVLDELSHQEAVSKWLVANQVDQEVVSLVMFSLIKEEELGEFDFKQSSGRMKENPRALDRRERLLAIYKDDSLIRYDPITNAWARIAKIPYKKLGIQPFGITLATLGDSLYLLCGENILRFDLQHHTWHEDVAPKNEPCKYVSAVVLKGSLYALGGPGSSTVERYDARNNTWHRCTPMQQPRSQPAVAVLDGRIYVAGGFGTKIGTFIECYCPHTDTWSYVSEPLPYDLSGYVDCYSLVSLEGCLYLLDKYMRVFAYRAKSDRWVRFTAYKFSSKSRIYALNGKLYANCGYYFRVLDRGIIDGEFRWWWHQLETSATTEKVQQDVYHAARPITYYGLDCVRPSKTV